jgi:hypothetical protein
MRKTILSLTFAVSAAVYGASPAPSDEDIVVHVETRGATVIVDVVAPVAAEIGQAWDVLTDYPHMAEFVSNLRVSEVTSNNGNVLRVHQTGEAKKGPLRFAFETVRLVELVPPNIIRSRLLQGDFKSYEFTTTLTPRAEGVTIVNHGEYVPNRWVPPVVGPALIAAETRKQYGELRAEIMRRKNAAQVSLRDSTTSAPVAADQKR